MLRSQTLRYGASVESTTSCIEGIGSILVVDAAASAEAVECVARESERCPWLPVVVEHAKAPSAEVRLAVRLLPLAVRAAPGTRCDFEWAASALRRQPVTQSDLHRYITLRCVRPGAADLPCSTLQEEPWAQLSTSRSAYYEAFRKLGAIGPAVWKRVMIVAPFAGHRMSVERVARELGRDVRTMRAAIQQDIGVRTSVFSSTPGWQWVLEVVLRRSRLQVRHPSVAYAHACPSPEASALGLSRQHDRAAAIAEAGKC
jgi:hypothetical protein